MTVFWGILCVAGVWCVILCIRAAFYRLPEERKASQGAAVRDGAKAVQNLQKLIQCQTVSYHDKAKEDDEEFLKLIGMLPDLYPEVYKTCSVINMQNRALLFHWEGKNHGQEGSLADVFMAHFDVVPVNEKRWEEPPFAGIIREGVLWGRGAIDTKVTFNGILSAAEELIGEGFVPENDIYFAFSGQEEVNGPAATWIVSYFTTHDIRLGMVIDEGGAVVENVFPGVKRPVALVGIAEKGLLDVSYSVDMKGGHASAPGPHTPVGVLAHAAAKIEDKPFKMHLSAPVQQMFDTLGRASDFKYRLIFANMWCFKPVLDRVTRKKGGELNALVRTTVAFTQMQGSPAPNVISSDPVMRSNIRICPGETIDSVLRGLKERAGTGDVHINTYGSYSMDPSPISRTDSAAYKKVREAILKTWEGVLVSPYLMVQCSDSRHYRDVSDCVYRFSAQALSGEERKMIHGDNERITLEQIEKSVMFFKNLMRMC